MESGWSSGGGARFCTTRWTLIQSAGENGPGQPSAWDHLCSTYWYPVYAFIRRRGETPEDARDLTQAFFAKLIEQNWLQQVQRRETRFSTLLIAILKNFLVRQYRYDHAQKRGGSHQPVPLDMMQAENWYGQEPRSEETPESLFEKRWAMTVMETALSHLREDCLATGKEKIFGTLSPFLSREPGPGDYDAAGKALGLSSRSIAVAVHRLRQEYRAAVRAEVAAGLTDSNMVNDEMRALASALGL